MFINQRIKFERILCPIGHTPDSGEALRYAIALAKSYRAKLLVMHCTGAYQTPSAIDQCHVEESLQDLIATHLRFPSTPLDVEVIVVEGDAPVAITREAAERRIGL